MKPTLPKPKRCAVYTRKSTEHNLDLAFNSLDAQREACEAYIKSQAHEGWRLVPDHYDDGGLSGASLDRPALQGLLTLVRARKVDVIVVYKVDRLTRSLADFAKLVEEFDAHDVSFVSVTQSFNTTSSMGRLTLNVLLSFAQFEREVIGERVRDKISASKRKGIWVGGPLPLGYRSRDKVLEIEEDEAATVRTIFERYLQLGSIGLLAEALDRDGIRSRGGYRFGVGGLAHILKNRFYIGEVVYRGEVHPGAQEPIIAREVFEAAQAQLAGRAVSRKLRLSRSPSFLAGLLYDDRGNRMSPSHANKRGVRYRYYVSQAVLQSRKADVGSVGRVSAPDVEMLVVSALRQQVPSEPEASDRDLVARHVAAHRPAGQADRHRRARRCRARDSVGWRHPTRWRHGSMGSATTITTTMRIRRRRRSRCAGHHPSRMPTRALHSLLRNGRGSIRTRETRCCSPSPRLAAGWTALSRVRSLRSTRSPTRKARPSATSAVSPRLPSCHPGSFRPSRTAARQGI